MNEKHPLPEVTIYTDGACSPNPGPGGWGAVILEEGKSPHELSGFGGNSTNNRMELTAVISALAEIKNPHRITIYTDSQYVKNGITSWITGWQKKNWQTADKKPVKNVDLWKALLKQVERHHISWKWVRGHAENKWNERADELAVAARKEKNAERDTAPADNNADATDSVSLYTGVTCKHSSGVGAWCVILCWRHHIKILGARTEGMTANQLYIKAVIEGLSTLTRPFPVKVHTHSGYLKDGATSWLTGWKKRNWQTREGSPVSNRELWQDLAALLERFKVTFHLDDRDNPLCFMQEAKELAREFEDNG
jgi:ribonuclease HI